MSSLETVCIPPLTRFRRHEHDGLHFCAVLDGGFMQRQGRCWREMGTLLIRISNATRHDIDFGPAGARCLVGELPQSVATPTLRKLNRPQFIGLDDWLRRVMGRLEAASARDDAARAVVIDALVTELVAQLERRIDGRCSPPPPWLRRVREHIDDSRGRATLKILARDAGVHRVHLARAFREHFGVPVTEYARLARLAVAQRLLATESLPLAQVAAQAGFSDQSHLTRVMRSTLATTPGAVRRSMLQPYKTARRDGC